MKASEELVAAREAFAHGDTKRACDGAWRAASTAAQVGDETTLAQVVELAESLAAAGADEGAQLRAYAAACLEDAQKGTRPPSAFERLIARRRPR